MPDRLPLERSLTRWRRRSDVLSLPVEHETVVLQRTLDEASVLDAVATQIWALLVDPVTEAHIADELEDRFGDGRHLIAADVSQLLSELEGHSLVHRLVD